MGESPQAFAERVQGMIAARAKLAVAPWDGYLKYYTLGVKVGFCPVSGCCCCCCCCLSVW